jgi:hypothetical protein
LVFLFGACASEEPAPRTEGELFGEGTRLRAIWEQAPGAPKVLLGWYDTALGAECTFQSSPAESGPAGRSTCRPLPYRSGTLSLFADSACTVPILPGGVRWFFEISPEPCGGSPGTLYELGEVADPSSVYWVAAGACQPAPATLASVEYRYIARALGRDALVSASRARRIEGARVVPIDLEASDGSWAQVGAYDTLLETEVVLPRPWPLIDFGLPSNPNVPSGWSPDARPSFDLGAPSLFSEPTCSTPAAESFGCGVSPFVRGVATPLTCGDTGHRFFRTGPELASSSVHRSEAPGTCESLPADPTGFRYFTVGSPLSEEDLAPVAVVERGADRLKLRLAGTNGGPVIGSDGYTDTREGTICRTRTAADGVLRCLPRINFDVRYGDSACTERVVGVESCAERPSRVSAYTSGDLGAPVFSVLDATAEAVFDRDANGACLPGTIAPGRLYYQLGPELPPSDFVEVARSAHD